jgi:hypothetical protein
MGFAMYQLQPQAIDGRGVGWYHRGDYDEWLTESLTYRQSGDKITLGFTLRHETQQTPLEIGEAADGARTLTLAEDPRDFWRAHTYRDMGPSFAVLGWIGGCMEPPWSVDLEGPRVVRASVRGPRAIEVAVREKIVVELSEALDPATVRAGRVVLVPWEEVGSCAWTPSCARGSCERGRCMTDPLTEGDLKAIDRGDSRRSRRSSWRCGGRCCGSSRAGRCGRIGGTRW